MMKFYLNKITTNKPHKKNPFDSDDKVMNFLLLHDNWNNVTGQPLTLTYAINAPDTEPNKFYENYIFIY